MGGVVKEMVVDCCCVLYVVILFVFDFINWVIVIDKVLIIKWNISNSFVVDVVE